MGAAAEGTYAQHEAPPVLLEADDEFLEVGGSPYLRRHNDVFDFSTSKDKSDKVDVPLVVH